MSLVPYHPFRDLERFFGGWPEMWEPAVDRIPRVDVYETDGNVVAEFELPGIKAENIDLEVGGNTIKVEARMDEKKEDKKKGYYRKEIRKGYYRRVIPLSVDIKEDAAEAEYKDGVLKVVVPKFGPRKTEKKGKKIKIKTRKN